MTRNADIGLVSKPSNLMAFQRVIQALSLVLFLLALIGSPNLLLWVWPADGFLGMDPLACLGTLVADRHFPPMMWVGAIILLLSMVFGRIFCAYLCPMGTSIDIGDHLLRRHRKAPIQPARRPSRRLKYHVLAFILGAGGLGVSFVFFASPMSLITRFYALIIYPVLAFMADMGLTVLRPIADRLDLAVVAYAVIKVPRYDMPWVTLILLLLIFAGGLLAPRFWCRYLCPSGALLAFFARRPIMRRQVSSDCTQCGLCLKACPMGAIGDKQADKHTDARLTDHAECITCLACVTVCPVRAVDFAFKYEKKPVRFAGSSEMVSLERRKILWAGFSGAAAAIITFTGLKSPYSNPGPGSIIHPAVIRPPGAVPENAFLARCIRCGACMQACPTNSLQPLGLATGLSAFFSPVITPRRGPCEPACNACGRVCPTGAIASLPMVEKLKAKMGTARISRQKCLAWELEKKCLICDEVCPYDAIAFRKPTGMRIAVPFVNENKCVGCGYCEHYCPVRASAAITVAPMLALRLSEVSYRAAARERGYTLEIGIKKDGRPSGHIDPATMHPTPLDGNGLPPGFTE